MSGRLTGVYQLPDGGFPPRDSKLWIRVPVDRNQGGVTVYSAPTMVPINPPTHPTAPGFYDSGLLPEGPYQVQKAIFGAKDYRSTWYSVVLTEGSHTVQELIDDYDPDLYTPPVVSEVAVMRDETRSARDEAAQILEDVEAGAVPDSAVAAKITTSNTATRAAVDARVKAVGDNTYVRSVNGTPVGPDGNVDVETAELPDEVVADAVTTELAGRDLLQALTSAGTADDAAVVFTDADGRRGWVEWTATGGLTTLTKLLICAAIGFWRGPTQPPFPPGVSYSWHKTDPTTGELIDILDVTT